VRSTENKVYENNAGVKREWIWKKIQLSLLNDFVKQIKHVEWMEIEPNECHGKKWVSMLEREGRMCEWNGR
jgi:hypothetical protein